MNMLLMVGIILVLVGIIVGNWGKWIVQIPQNEVWVTEIFKSYFRQLKSKKHPYILIPFLEKIPKNGKVNLKREVHDLQVQKVLSKDGFEIPIDYSIEIHINDDAEAIKKSVYDYKAGELIEKIQVESDSAVRSWAANKNIETIIKTKSDGIKKILEDLQDRFKDETIFSFDRFAIKNIEVSEELVKGLREIKQKTWEVKKSKLEIKRQKNIGEATKQRINEIAKAYGVSEEEAKQIYLKEIQIISLEKNPAKVIIAKSGSAATDFIEGFEASK